MNVKFELFFLYLVKNCLIKTYVGMQVGIQSLLISAIIKGGKLISLGFGCFSLGKGPLGPSG